MNNCTFLPGQMTFLPTKLGGAKRIPVSERELQIDQDMDEDEVYQPEDEFSTTPKAERIQRSFDFDAPQHHNFNEEDTFTADSWFGNLFQL